MARGVFPRPVRLTEGTVAWVSSEIDAWIKAKIADPNSRLPLNGRGKRRAAKRKAA
jgi:hypothetical protein